MNVTTLIKQSIQLARQKQFKKAKKLCERAIKNDEKNLASWILYGDLSQQVGDLKEAETSYQKVIQIDPTSCKARERLAILWQNNGNFDAALSSYKEILRLNPNQPHIHFSAGVILQQQLRLNDAESNYRKAIDIKPDYVEAYVNLGTVLVKQNRLSEAEVCYKYALSLRPHALHAHINLGSLYGKKHRIGDAVSHYRHALQIDPRSIDANIGLATSLCGQGRFLDTPDIYKTILDIDPDNAEAQHMLAAIESDEAPLTAKPEYVAKLFDGYADSFDAHLVDQLDYKVPQLLDVAIREIADEANTGLRILDLGCGTGLCGPLLKDIASSIIGVDLSPKMLECARSKNVYNELVDDDISHYLKNSDDKFDLILATDVFVYIGDLEEVFSLCKQALNTGGFFAFSVELCENFDNYLLREAGRYAQSLKYIQELSSMIKFKEVYSKPIVVRKENDNPVQGQLIILTVI